jgi:GAF domain-containing protein/DNA-binding response OmpR family regulator
MTSHTQNLPYSERVIRRTVPIVALVLTVVTLVMIGVSIINLLRTVRTEHQAILNDLTNQIENQLNQIVSDIGGIRNDIRLSGFIDGTTSMRDATQRSRDLITSFPNDVLAVRLIDDTGRILMNVENVRGFPQIVIETQLSLLEPLEMESEFFLALSQADEQVVIGNFRLQRNPQNNLVLDPPRAKFSMYLSVAGNDNVVNHGLEVIIDGTPFLNIVNRAEINVPQRTLIWTSGTNLVVANSEETPTTFLRQLEDTNGNFNTSDFYPTLRPFTDSPTIEQTEVVSGLDLFNVVGIDIENTNEVPWRIFLIDNIFVAYRLGLIVVGFFVLGATLLGVISSILIRAVVTNLLEPVDRARSMVENLAQGDASIVSSSATDVPFVSSVANVAQKIDTLSREFDEEVERRNRDMRVMGRISYETAVLSDLDVLLRRTINLICNEMGYYHASVFLVDEIEGVARVVASRGEAGQELLARAHRIQIGSPTVVGTTAAQRRPVVLNDVNDPNNEVKHGFNPLLPETRAEMCIPLIVGEQLIGALDIQSTQPYAFQKDDQPTFELLANQVSVAIYNAQLKSQSDRRIQQIDRLNRQLTRDAWEDFAEKVALGKTYGKTPEQSHDKASASITIRGESIGQIEAALTEGQSFTEGDQVILQAVAERMAIAIENARLFQETQISLTETSTLYDLSQQLNEANTLTQVLDSIVHAVVKDAVGAQVWFFDDYPLTSRPQIVRLAADLILVSPDRSLESIADRTYRIAEMKLSEPTLPNALIISLTRNTEYVKEALVRSMFEVTKTKSILLIKLNMRGVWKGFLTFLFDDENRQLSESETRIFNALGVQAGITIDNRLLLQQTEQALERNEKLYSASRLINTARNLSDLVYAAVATSSESRLNFWLGLLEGDSGVSGWRDYVRIVAKSDNSNVVESDELLRLEIHADSPLRLREPEVLNIKDSKTGNPDQRLYLFDLQFMAIFPLFVENTPIALFYITSKEPHELSADDYDVYKALTGQMSTQIQNRNLLSRTEAALNETRRLYIASRAISSIQDVQKLFELLPTQLVAPFLNDNKNTMMMSILLARPKPSTDAPELEYVYHWMNKSGFTSSRQGTLITQQELPLAHLLETSDDGVLVFNDLNAMRDSALRSFLRQENARGAIVAPIRVRQLWFGALIIHASDTELINEGYTRFVLAIADQIAVALENQNLIQEAQNERSNLNNILSTLPAGVLVLDPETMIPIQINERIVVLLGREIDFENPFTPVNYHIYRTGTQLIYPDKELPINSANEENRQMFADDLTILFEGYQADLLVNATPIFDNNGRKTAIVAAFQDISNLRSLENTLQENLHETVTLYESQRSLSEAETMEQLLDTILTQLMLQQVQNGLVLLQDEQTGEITQERVTEMPLEDTQWLKPFLQSEIISIDDMNETDLVNENNREVLMRMGIANLLSLPLKSKSRLVPLGWVVIIAPEPSTIAADQERILTTLIDMSSTAIDNNYLVRSTQVALQETASLYAASTSINRSRDLDELSFALQNAILEQAPSYFAAFIYRDNTITPLFDEGFSEHLGQADLEQIILGDLDDLGESSSLFVADISEEKPNNYLYEVAKMQEVKGFFAVNLRLKDTLGGRLFLVYKEPHEYTDGDTRFLNTIADNTSVVVDNMLLLNQIQNTLQETSVLYQASRALSETNNPQDIVDVVVDQLVEPHVTRVILAILNRSSWDSAGATATVTASWQMDEESMSLFDVRFTQEQFPLWNLLSTEQVTIVDDVSKPEFDLNELEIVTLQSLDLVSMAIIPLRTSTRAIGVIWLGSNIPHQYTERDLRVFQSFGEQTSLSLEAARLLEQTEKRAKQLQTTAQISQNVGQILDLGVLLPNVVNLIRDRFQYDHVQVFLMDAEKRFAVLNASTGEAGRQLLARNHKLEKGSKSVIGQVTENKRITVALDTSNANVVHKPNPFLPLTRSEIGVPIILKDEIAGVLDVQSNQPNAFTEDDIQTLEALAIQIGIAVDNARLYNDAQVRANELGFLFDVTNAAANADNLDDVLQSVTERLHESLEMPTVAFYLPESQVDFQGNIRTMLQAKALKSDGIELTELPAIAMNYQQNLLVMSAEKLQSTIVGNLARETGYTPINKNSLSAIITPIQSGSEVVGIIVMENNVINAFNNDTRTLLLTMAGSIAALIQNTLLVEQLQSSNDQLREVDRLKSQFLANMSHELRTPLNSIIGFSRVMLKGIDGPLTEMQEQDLNTIYNSGNHLLNLINDILDQAKIEAKEMQLNVTEFDIKPMIEGVKSIAIGLLKDKQLQLFVEVAPNLPTASGDELRSRQVLLNLVSNAVKFTQEGSINLRVYVENYRGKNYIRVDVIDSGIGIAEADMPILFEQFRQVDNSLTRTVGGTGLGLPISKSLAELQGGHLLVSSVVGQGSTFSVLIPVYVESQAKPKTDELKTTSTRLPSKGRTGILPSLDAAETNIIKLDETKRTTTTMPNPMKMMPEKRDVLLIEDNKDMVDQFRRALQREGFEVQTADHPSYAEAMVGQIRPTMVIMDVNFANGMGWTLLKNLKSRDDTADVPILVTTLSNERERALEIGASSFMQRPFMPDQLIRTVLDIEKENKAERILIIDDQPDAIRLLKQLLDEHGNYRVYVASSGREGISMVARRRPNLVILDLRMPEMDGFQVLNELRANPETANIPVMVVTGEINLNDNESQQLTNVRVLQKTDISNESYEAFLEDIRAKLKNP